VAQAQAVRILQSTAGEPAVNLLSRADQSANGRGQTDSSGRAGWKLNDTTWKELTGEAGERMTLSGIAAARLLNARRQAAITVNQALGQQSRFSRLVPVHRGAPALTRFQLYWETMERALADRPLTILDPQATSRAHLILADPERIGPALFNDRQPANPVDGGRPAPATVPPEQEP